MVGGNDYVIQVKGNQKKLKESIIAYIQKNNPEDKYETIEKNRGREEIRITRVYIGMRGSIFDSWQGLKSIIVVDRKGKRKHKGKIKKYIQTHYYISSKEDTTAKEFAKGIRAHWLIENSLHWVKDVILNEDGSLIKNKVLSENLSIIRIIVMNLYRLDNQESIKYAIEQFSNRLDKCRNLIYEKFRSE